MDTAAAALPVFVALLLLSPWPLLGSAQGQFSAGEWPGRGAGWEWGRPELRNPDERPGPGFAGGGIGSTPGLGTRV